MNPKQMLFVQVSIDQAGSFENATSSVCEMLGIDCQRYVYRGIREFHTDFAEQQPFDYVYWASHGNEFQFCSHSCPQQDSFQEPWNRLGYYICMTQILADNGVLILGCCQGGLKKIALDLFYNCPQIRFICGPRHSINGGDLALCLHVFLHHIHDPAPEYSVAATRAGQATGRSFPFYDRFDLQHELDIKDLLVMQGGDVDAMYMPHEGDDPIDLAEFERLDMPQAKSHQLMDAGH